MSMQVRFEYILLINKIYDLEESIVDQSYINYTIMENDNETYNNS